MMITNYIIFGCNSISSSGNKTQLCRTLLPECRFNFSRLELIGLKSKQTSANMTGLLVHLTKVIAANSL